MDTFGLQAELLQLRSLETREEYCLSLTDETTPVPATTTSFSSASAGPPVCFDSRLSVLQSLYLLERFGVSDEFYHELSMVFPDLPRSYQIKRARWQLSSHIEVEALPPPCHGSVRPFTRTLAAALAVEVGAC